MFNFTHRDLLLAFDNPQHSTGLVAEYIGLIVAPNGSLHDSGYECMNVWGLLANGQIEIISKGCDSMEMEVTDPINPPKMDVVEGKQHIFYRYSFLRASGHSTVTVMPGSRRD